MALKILALGLMAIFYLCYFSKMLKQKKQGIHMDQLGKDKECFLKFIEIALKTATYLLPALQIISIVFAPGNNSGALLVAGIVIELLGVVAFVASVREMKDNWRAGVQRKDKTNLVTTGIYAISRNPAFLGFILMYIGILCAFFNWCLLVATVLAVGLFHLQIVKVEEPFLIETFGQEYLAYQKKVCRYLGNKL